MKRKKTMGQREEIAQELRNTSQHDRGCQCSLNLFPHVTRMVRAAVLVVLQRLQPIPNSQMPQARGQ